MSIHHRSVKDKKTHAPASPRPACALEADTHALSLAAMSYLNHAGTSWPKPAVVRAAVASLLEGATDDWDAGFEAAHRRVASALGVTDPGRLLLTPGCTSALQLALSDLPWEPGERVLTSGLEHHALMRPVTLLRRRGVEPTVVPRGPDGSGGPLDLAALERELAGGGVRLVALTAACNVTGELLPVAEAVALAHAHGALCLIDGAQIAGWLSVDVGALGVDLFAFAGHKGLQAPWGIGGLYVAPHVALASPGASCGLPAAGSQPSCSSMPDYCDAGSVDRAALAGLVAALDWLDQPEQADRLDRARGHVERLAAALEARPGVRLHGTRDPRARLPTLALTLERRPTSAVAAAFGRHGVTVGAGLQCAPLAHESLGTAPDGVVRLSAGPLTGEREVERALEVVAEL